MVSVWEDLGLMGQICAATVHQINAGQVIVLGDFLRPQVFFHRAGIITAALYSGIICHNHTFLPKVVN